MFYKKTGLPEESALVICTITKIQYHSVFARLNAWGISGMIHISEIAPGRIRNINDYVKEGKVVVCKVLKVNQEKGHVDLSLRRVNDSQRRTMINQMKFEQKSEKIIEFVAKELKMDAVDLYNKISALTDNEFIHETFELVVEQDLSLEKLGLDPMIAKKLEEVIRLRIKPKEVKIGGSLELKLYHGKGIEIIKKTLMKAEKVKGAEIRYLGGGKFQIEVIAKDYKEAEPNLKKALDIITKDIESNSGTIEFKRK